MKHIRRAYYDRFSRFYDRFVALHSRDTQGLARKFLADQIPAGEGASILDLCTGTATLLSYLRARVGALGRVIGVDFSPGMLRVASEKTRCLPGVYLVEADAGNLPFAGSSFDAITCSHAFYELKGETKERALSEIVRVLKPKGVFLMMEHDIPPKLLVRGLFYLRLAVIGAGRALTFLRQEREVLERYFESVEKLAAPAGRSKVMVCPDRTDGSSSLAPQSPLGSLFGSAARHEKSRGVQPASEVGGQNVLNRAADEWNHVDAAVRQTLHDRAGDRSADQDACPECLDPPRTIHRKILIEDQLAPAHLTSVLILNQQEVTGEIKRRRNPAR